MTRGQDAGGSPLLEMCTSTSDKFRFNGVGPLQCQGRREVAIGVVRVSGEDKRQPALEDRNRCLFCFAFLLQARGAQ